MISKKSWIENNDVQITTKSIELFDGDCIEFTTRYKDNYVSIWSRYPFPISLILTHDFEIAYKDIIDNYDTNKVDSFELYGLFFSVERMKTVDGKIIFLFKGNKDKFLYGADFDEDKLPKNLSDFKLPKEMHNLSYRMLNHIRNIYEDIHKKAHMAESIK